MPCSGSTAGALEAAAAAAASEEEAAPSLP